MITEETAKSIERSIKRGWTQNSIGHYSQPRGKVCLMGAIHRENAVRAVDMSDLVEYDFAIVNTLRVMYPDYHYSLGTFNDDSSTHKRDVLKVLRETRKRVYA